jgi:hypothetical protein
VIAAAPGVEDDELAALAGRGHVDACRERGRDELGVRGRGDHHAALGALEADADELPDGGAQKRVVRAELDDVIAGLRREKPRLPGLRGFHRRPANGWSVRAVYVT